MLLIYVSIKFWLNINYKQILSRHLVIQTNDVTMTTLAIQQPRKGLRDASQTLVFPLMNSSVVAVALRSEAVVLVALATGQQSLCLTSI